MKKNTGRDLKVEIEPTVSRGMLTTTANDVAKKFLGRSMSLAELRLVPYIQYVMVNERRIDPNHVNGEERKILAKWKEEGHIEGGACGLSITKHFWDFMCEVLFIAYVGYDNDHVFEPKEAS